MSLPYHKMYADAIAWRAVRFPHLSFVAQLLPCCSVCAMLLSLCRVAHLCRVAQFWQYLGTGDIEQRTVTQSLQYYWAQETLSNELWPSLGNICAQETLSNELWPSLGNKLIKSNFRERKNRWPRSWHLCSFVDLESITVGNMLKIIKLDTSCKNNFSKS